MAGLIRRQKTRGGVTSVAVYSGCERYRYSLTRTWDREAPRLLWIMLNPSTADELRNDPTIERCERRTRALGCGAYRIVNLFGFRATLPSDLRQADDPVGPDNDRLLYQSATRWVGSEGRSLCGWGVHGALKGQGAVVLTGLKRRKVPLWHLGLTKDGHPRHPLYIAYAQAPIRWTFT